MSNTPRTAAQMAGESHEQQIARLTRELAEWHRIAGEKIAALERERDALQSKHCKDCCCAQSWDALGVSDSAPTIGEIVDHILALRSERDILLAEKRTFWKEDGELRAEVERLTAERDALRYEVDALRGGMGGGMHLPESTIKLRAEVERLTRERDALKRLVVSEVDTSRIAALREMRSMLANGDYYPDGFKENVLMKIDAMIKREEER